MPKLAETPTPDPAGPVERIGRIAELVEASGDHNEALGRLSSQVVDKLHEERLFRMLLPRAYGGEEIDLVIACNISRCDGPEHRFTFEPSTASRLRDQCGVDNEALRDRNGRCIGGVTGLRSCN